MSNIIVKNNIFILETATTHYVIGIDNEGNNHHLHWGVPCPYKDYDIPTYEDENSNHPARDCFRQEYTPFGHTMYRECVLKATFEDGCREVILYYIGYEQNENTLSLIFRDVHYPLTVKLNYQVFDACDIIIRSVTVENTGNDTITLEKLMSGELSLPGTSPYHIMNTNGAWGAEFLPTNTLLDGGSLVYESRRGISGHNHSPFFIAHHHANENDGEVFFANLAWSGSFKVEISRDLFGVTRAVLGINDFDFNYLLHSGESMTTPEIILGRSIGFGEMSRQLHHFTLTHILPATFADKPLPILYNSWEATTFHVDIAGQTALAEKAAAVGCELFVMDDGWFGARNNDKAGLGDWFVNPAKFPNGLGELIEKVNQLGMAFGLWVEPEMINLDSDLYRRHPDWMYQYPTRENNLLRWQCVLNMTRKDVQDYIFNALDTLLTENNIAYIKWDMNRPFSEVGADNLEQPKMLWYLHTKAVYDIVDKLKKRHPHVAFESCASGGGRCDFGALRHFDMIWTSDNTDAIDRINLQKGYALTRPIKTMRAWVTDAGNGYNRDCPLGFRFNIAMRGALGLGGNLLNYSKEEMAICREYNALYKRHRNLIQFGNLYRLLDYDRDEISADLYLNDKKTSGVLFIAAVNTRCYKKELPLRLYGLEDAYIYRLTIDGKTYEKSGAYLKNAGVPIRIRKQYHHEIIEISSIK